MKIITADERLKQSNERGWGDMAFELGDVVNASDIWKPQRILVSSVQGLGKTTIGATFEDAILAQIEDGAGAVDCATFPEQVKTFQDMEAVITALHGDHPYKALVGDTLDWLEPLVWARLIEAEPTNEKGKEVGDIEGYGFGKGYVKALRWWKYLMSGFESLRKNKGMNIILLAHTEVKRYDPPDSDPYDRYHLKLHKLAAALWQEWADIVLFCNYKTRIEKSDVGFGKEVKRGKGTGERIIYTEERPAFLAKNRWGLPPEIYIGNDKTWSGFHKALNEATGGRYAMPGAAVASAGPSAVRGTTAEQAVPPSSGPPDQKPDLSDIPDDDIPF